MFARCSASASTATEGNPRETDGQKEGAAGGFRNTDGERHASRGGLARDDPKVEEVDLAVVVQVALDERRQVALAEGIVEANVRLPDVVVRLVDLAVLIDVAGDAAGLRQAEIREVVDVVGHVEA